MSKKEKSMGNSNGKITAPVGLQPDMYGVQGLVKTGTFYDVVEANRNAHDTINPFAKYKPTRYSSPNGGTGWWRANDGNCGFTGFSLNDGVSLVTACLNKSAWVYQPPRPGTDWCRMADWDGYNHNAKPFVTVESVENGYGRTYITENEQSIQFNSYLHPDVTFRFNTSAAEGQLSIDDFSQSALSSTLKDACVAALLYEGYLLEAEAPRAYFIGDKVSGSTQPEVAVSLSGVAAGSFNIILALAFEAMNPSFLPLPGYIIGEPYQVRASVVRNQTDVRFYLNALGWDQYSTNPAMEYLSNLQITPLTVGERGCVQLRVNIDTEYEALTLSDANYFRLEAVRGGTTVYQIADGNFRIKSINGSTNISYPYTIPRRSTQTEVILGNTSNADVTFPTGFPSATYELRLRRRNDSSDAPALGFYQAVRLNMS